MLSRADNDNKWKLYILAAALTLGIVPWTLLVMARVNARLHAAADVGVGVMARRRDKGKGRAVVESTQLQEDEDEAEMEMEMEGESIKALVDWWGVLNLGRGVWPLLGALVGGWAVLG